MRTAALVLTLSVAAGTRAEPMPCSEDARLTETAAALLLRDERLAASTLLSAARAHGFDGVSVHARESASEVSLRVWLAQLAQRGEGRLTCGEARGEARRLLLAAVRGGSLRRAGDQLFGTLEPGFAAPALIFEASDGSLASLRVTPAQLARGVRLSPDEPPHRVQLTATSASGPRPIAQLELVQASEQVPANVAAPSSRPPLEQLSALRRAGGMGTLRDNRLLASSARQHAARVCQLGKLAHRLDGEDPEARLARAHVSARGVAEVIARAASSEAALRVLLASPAHRLAMLRPDLTDVGLGEARDDKGRTCLVVLLAAWPQGGP